MLISDLSSDVCSSDLIGVIQADHAMTDWSKPMQVASVQTLQRRGMPEVDLAIVDEAHVRNQWLEKQFGSGDWGKKPVIGLSATPWSKGLGLIYDELIAPIRSEERRVGEECVSK